MITQLHYLEDGRCPRAAVVDGTERESYEWAETLARTTGSYVIAFLRGNLYSAWQVDWRGCWSLVPAQLARDMLETAPAVHDSDEQCIIDPQTNECVICHVVRGDDPCPICGGWSFHRAGCE